LVELHRSLNAFGVSSIDLRISPGDERHGEAVARGRTRRTARHPNAGTDAGDDNQSGRDREAAAKNRPWAFRNALSSDQMNGYLLDVWLKRNPVKSVVILTDVKDAFTKVDGTVVFPTELKQKNVQVLDNISYQTGDIDYSAQVTKAKGLNPEGIVVAGLYNEGGNVVREIRKQGMKQPIVGALGMSEPRFLDIAGPGPTAPR